MKLNFWPFHIHKWKILDQKCTKIDETNQYGDIIGNYRVVCTLLSCMKCDKTRRNKVAFQSSIEAEMYMSELLFKYRSDR